MTSNQPFRPHSADYFGEDRNYLWNSDYLDLLAKRLGLCDVRSIADVGCGVGHWSAVLRPRAAAAAKLVGVDSDLRNLVGFQDRCSDIGNGDCTAIHADAAQLPLADAAFDLVTCQTLLIHVPEPEQVLMEMVRVTRPGGLVLCVEPNNLAGRLPSAWLLESASIECQIRLAELAFRYVLGRVRRGLGHDYFGDLLPGMFAMLGLQDVTVWLCDKTVALFPPYESPAQRAVLQAYERWRADGTGPFDRTELRQNALAGGATSEFFELAWRDYVAQDDEMRRAMAEYRWSSAAGALLYIVCGRRR